MATTSGSVGNLAGLGKRIGAFIIDSVVWGLAATILAVPVFLLAGLSGDGGTGFIVTILYYLTISVLSFAYLIGLEGMFGYTVGKKLLGIRVVDENGGKIGMGAAAMRNLLRMVDALPTLYLVGIALIVTNDDEQRVGDMVANTYVVDA